MFVYDKTINLKLYKSEIDMLTSIKKLNDKPAHEPSRDRLLARS